MNPFEEKDKNIYISVYNFREFTNQPLPQANPWTKLITPYTQIICQVFSKKTLGKGHHGIWWGDQEL